MVTDQAGPDETINNVKLDAKMENLIRKCKRGHANPDFRAILIAKKVKFCCCEGQKACGKV